MSIEMPFKFVTLQQVLLLKTKLHLTFRWCLLLLNDMFSYYIFGYDFCNQNFYILLTN